MKITRQDGSIKMEPVVWVRSISTLFYETACGSGTTAVGLVEAVRNGVDVNIPVLQPSGMQINIEVGFDGDRFSDAFISGPIEQIHPLAQF